MAGTDPEGADAARPIFRPGLSAADLRASARSRPLKPYEILETLTPAGDPAFKRKCDRILMDGWSAGGVAVELEPPFPWLSLERSAAFDLHSWKPLTKLLTAYSLYGQKRYLNASRVMIRDWTKAFHPPTEALETHADLDAFIGRDGDPVWYDMSVGHRVYRMAYLLDILARDDSVTDAEIERLGASIYLHHEALTNERFFKGHNNHGLYQALGQLAAAERFPDLPRMDEYAALAAGRLERMIHEHFFDSGVHKEHSPGYHYMLAGSLVSARSSGVLVSERFGAILQGMEEAMGWMIQPNGTLVPLGDTDPLPMEREPGVAEQYQDPGVRFLMTGGAIGTPPAAGVKAYDDAGYVFARLPGADGQWAYLAQHAGFHSRTHKHADHLAFQWHDRGRDILVEPGRFAFKGKTKPDTPLHRDGFWYADPRRVYVESTRAHNTVCIDGQNHARVGARPFGSAIVQANEQNGMAVSETYLTHAGGVRHRRVLVMAPGEFLLVLDWLSDKDGGGHDFAQHFHLAPAWQASADEGGFRAEAPDAPPLRVVSLTGADLLPVLRGQTEPDLAGWTSDKADSLVPAAAFGFEAKGTAQTVFAGLFAFAEALEPIPGEQRVSDTLTTGRFAWLQDGRRRTLSLRRGSGQPTVVDLDREAP